MTTLLVGSYSNGAPDGVRVVTLDDATGALRLDRGLAGAPDASFFAWDAATRRLYVTDEFAPAVGGFVLDAGCTALAPLGTRPAGANYPCYVRLSPDRSRLALANYGADLVEVFALADGKLQPNPVQLRGSQSRDGHAHWVQWSPEGDRLYLVDLGHDEVRMHAVTADGFGPAAVAFAMPKGAGPRHLAFHPDGRTAYLFTEYASTLTALAREPDGTLRELQTVSTLPADFAGESTGAHIQISDDGRAVYVSNRGHNSIAVFSIADDGTLTHRQTVSCGGDWPRFFLRLGRRLIVANQKSGDLIGFDVADDGTLAPSGQRLAIPTPVAILAV